MLLPAQFWWQTPSVTYPPYDGSRTPVRVREELRTSRPEETRVSRVEPEPRKAAA